MMERKFVACIFPDEFKPFYDLGDSDPFFENVILSGSIDKVSANSGLTHFVRYKPSILMHLMAVSNKVTFSGTNLRSFFPFLFVVSGHRRAELA